MRWKKFYNKIKGNPKNIRYDDMVSFLQWLQFDSRQKGTSHKIFFKDGVEEIINIQNRKGKIDPYQVRQVVWVIEKYSLTRWVK